MQADIVGVNIKSEWRMFFLTTYFAIPYLGTQF